MISMNDFKSEPLALREGMLAAAQRVLESGWYVLGNEVEHFETAWAVACGVSHAIGVGNGMDAIEIALRSLDIGPGDEVITTPMTAFATVLAIYRAGAIPVLADIEPETALLSLDSVERCVTQRTKAVLLVHLYGQVCNITAFHQFCENLGIYLIEDCAQAHLARSEGRSAGSFGVAGAYSFYPTKNLGAPGDAGMLVTNDADIAIKAGRLRNYGQSVRYHHPELGLNSRLDEIQAAMLTERLKWLNEFTSRRQAIAQAFHNGITNPSVRLLTAPASKEAHVYHLFVVTCAQREAFQAHLRNEGVEALIHYPLPVHHQEPCLSIQRDPDGLAASERHAATCLSLPCHPQMSDEDVQTVISAVNRFRVR
jgi:dTDP-4-amino-4,6-dideoxygalactose transaminase